MTDAGPARTEAETGTGRASPTFAADLVTVLPAWLTARLLVVAAYVVARLVIDRFGIESTPFEDGLLAWDGTWYHDIARLGYDGIDPEGLRFFPLFPVLGDALGGALGATGVALVVLSNVASLALGVLILRLMRVEGRAEAAARRAVWLTMLFPSAFVFVWGYAESLMLVGAVGAFLCLRTQRWALAAGAGLVAAMTRPIGIVLVVPAIIEVARTWRTSDTGERVGGMLAAFAPVAGTMIYLLSVQGAYGDALLPFRIQEDLRGEPINPIGRIWDGFAELVGPEQFGQGLHLPFALALVVLLVITFRRWPVSYGMYATGVLVLALSAENLNSLERYGLNAFPLLLTLALVTADDRVERMTLALCAGGFVALCSLAWLASYVP